MLPSFAELWPLSSWGNQHPPMGPPTPSQVKPSCCRWSSKASLYLQASSPSCRLFSKNQGLILSHKCWKIATKKQEKNQPWNGLMMFDAGEWVNPPLDLVLSLGLAHQHGFQHCNLKCARTLLKTGELNGEDCRSYLDCNLQNYQWPMSKSNSRKICLPILPMCTWTMSNTELEQKCQLSYSMSIEFVDCGKKWAAWVHLHSLATSIGDCLWFS